MAEPLITKYRPQNFAELYGNETIVNALMRAIASESRPHAFLFTGPSGIGKTTTARIVATDLNAEILEIDAASNSGVDAMRSLVEQGSHMALSGAGQRMFLIDEAHRLSRNSWDVLLKFLEEPPDHLYIALCTTEITKVPDTIVTRCYHVAFRPLKDNEIEDLLSVVSEAEGWTPTADVMLAVKQAGTGQPRKALSILQAVHDAPSREEVRRIIALTEETDALINLCRYLIKPKPQWQQIAEFLAKIDDADYENASTLAGRYILTVLLAEKQMQRAHALWALIDAFVFPAATYDKKLAFVAAIGRWVFLHGG